jgi:hypothetical protein
MHTIYKKQNTNKFKSNSTQDVRNNRNLGEKYISVQCVSASYLFVCWLNCILKFIMQSLLEKT